MRKLKKKEVEKMHSYDMIKISEYPEIIPDAAEWFHQKWGIPTDVYIESMKQCIQEGNVVPEWYVTRTNGRIIAGLGVIENDFHDRKDLTPNVCAVYVEEEYRCQGIAGRMLEGVCSDMKERGIGTLYLVTDHTSFYERYGWEFLCMVQGEGEPDMSRMYVHR